MAMEPLSSSSSQVSLDAQQRAELAAKQRSDAQLAQEAEQARRADEAQRLQDAQDRRVATEQADKASKQAEQNRQAVFQRAAEPNTAFKTQEAANTTQPPVVAPPTQDPNEPAPDRSPLAVSQTDKQAERQLAPDPNPTTQDARQSVNEAIAAPAQQKLQDAIQSYAAQNGQTGTTAQDTGEKPPSLNVMA